MCRCSTVSILSSLQFTNKLIRRQQHPKNNRHATIRHTQQAVKGDLCFCNTGIVLTHQKESNRRGNQNGRKKTDRDLRSNPWNTTAPLSCDLWIYLGTQEHWKTSRTDCQSGILQQLYQRLLDLLVWLNYDSGYAHCSGCSVALQIILGYHTVLGLSLDILY